MPELSGRAIPRPARHALDAAMHAWFVPSHETRMAA